MKLRNWLNCTNTYWKYHTKSDDSYSRHSSLFRLFHWQQCRYYIQNVCCMYQVFLLQSNHLPNRVRNVVPCIYWKHCAPINNKHFVLYIESLVLLTPDNDPMVRLTCALMSTDLLACLCFGLMLILTSSFSCSFWIPVSSRISIFSGISNIITSGKEP